MRATKEQVSKWEHTIEKVLTEMAGATTADDTPIYKPVDSLIVLESFAEHFKPLWKTLKEEEQ